jgi:hypothetical protein
VESRGRWNTTSPPRSAAGEILDDEGRTIGSFQAQPLTPFTEIAGLVGARALELQTFVLPGGALFGLALAPDRQGERACAVLGGTGDYEGAQGSYVERRANSTQRGTMDVEFEVRLRS